MDQMKTTKTKVAIALLGVSLILLTLSGIDVVIIFSSGSSQTTEDPRGFLPLDEKARGSAFGGGAVIMSIIAFVIAEKGTIKLGFDIASCKWRTNYCWNSCRGW